MRQERIEWRIEAQRTADQLVQFQPDKYLFLGHKTAVRTTAHRTTPFLNVALCGGYACQSDRSRCLVGQRSPERGTFQPGPSLRASPLFVATQREKGRGSFGSWCRRDGGEGTQSGFDEAPASCQTSKGGHFEPHVHLLHRCTNCRKPTAWDGFAMVV